MLPVGSVMGARADGRHHRLLDQIDLGRLGAHRGSRTARFSTWVISLGTPMTIRGLTPNFRL
jgi:hypothetical protein